MNPSEVVAEFGDGADRAEETAGWAAGTSMRACASCARRAAHQDQVSPSPLWLRTRQQVRGTNESHY